MRTIPGRVYIKKATYDNNALLKFDGKREEIDKRYYHSDAIRMREYDKAQSYVS